MPFESSLLPSSVLMPKFDMTEHDDDYELMGELPGLSSNDVDIEFTDERTLVVSGHTERHHTEQSPSDEGHKHKGKGGKQQQAPPRRYWLSERSYGEFSRVFSFPMPVDQEHAHAKFKDGVLDMVVPKAEKKNSRKVTVEDA
jgi:HSP20 family molecular chaperone IbpA